MLIFKDTSSRSLSIIKLVSRITPNCFSDDNWETLTLILLKTNGWWYISFALRLKITYWAFLVGSGLKLIFHWKVWPFIYYYNKFDHLFIISKSSLRSFAGVWVSCTTENKEVSWANSFFVVSPSVRSLM